MGGTTAADFTDNTLIDGGGGASTSYGFYIEGTASPTITGNTMIWGGAATANSYGIWTASTAATPPTIANNTIDGGTGATSATGIRNEAGNTAIEANTITVSGLTGTTYGIRVTGGAPEIERNHIQGGGGDGSFGLALATAAVIHNNTIHGGSGTATYGLYTNGGASVIINNTIYAGSGSGGAKGVDMATTATPDLTDNIIFGSGGSSDICVAEEDTGSVPISLTTNDLFNCPLALYRDEGGIPLHITTLADLNALAFATLNVSVDPLLADFAGNDWHFRTDGTSPCAVTQGADGNVSLDKDGNARPGADSYYSMGAYEWDGACAE
jgi:hypothetical protein